MGLQYVLSIFGRTLSDRPLSSAWRMTGKPEIVRGQESTSGEAQCHQMSLRPRFPRNPFIGTNPNHFFRLASDPAGPVGAASLIASAMPGFALAVWRVTRLKLKCEG